MVLEKATEIGIQLVHQLFGIIPERKVYKIDRAEKSFKAAMKQSLHYYIPKSNEPISFTQFVKSKFRRTKIHHTL